MLDARFSHLYFYQSLNRLQRGLSAIAELLVKLPRSSCHIIAFDERVPLVNAPVLGNVLRIST